MARSLMSIFGVVAALSMVACSGDKGDTAGGAEGEGEGETECSVDISGTFPESGETEFFYQAAVEAYLTEADSTATITLTDSAGAEVAGTTSVSDDGLTLYFTPDADLAPSTSYTFEISTCSGETGGSIDFATSILGTPLDCDLSGKSFRVALADARFVQPDPSVAALLFDQLEDDILVGVSSMGDTELDMLGALSNGAGAGQNYCYPSIPFPPASFSDPAFQVGPADTTLAVAGIEVTISDLGISGAFAPDCSYFGGGRLTGQLDARVLAPLISDLLGEDDPDAICTLLTTFGVTCGPCSSDGENYCAEVEVDQITASTAGASLSCISEEECHPSCPTSTCDDPTAGICD